MKSKLIALQTAAALIATSLAPLSAPSARAASNPNADCQATCGEYRRATIEDDYSKANPGQNRMSYDFVMAACGKPKGSDAKLAETSATSAFVGQTAAGGPSSSAGAGAVSDRRRGLDDSFAVKDDEDWNKCFKDLRDHYKMLGPHCSAMAVGGTATRTNKAVLGVYTAAAAVCAVACGAQATGYGASLKMACALGSGAASLADIAGLIAVKAKAEKETQRIRSDGERRADLGAFFFGGAAAGTQIAAQTGANAVVGKVNLSTCLTAGMLGAAAALKGRNIKSMKGNEAKQCERVRELGSLAASVAIDETSSGGGSGTQSLGARIHNALARVGGAADGGGSQALSAYLAASDGGPQASSFPPAQFAAAVGEGEFGAVFTSLSNPDEIPRALQAATGMSLTDLANRIDSGESAGQILSSIPAASSDVVQGVSALEKGLNDGSLELLAKDGSPIGGSMYASKGGAGAASGSKPAAPQFSFGMRAPAAGGAPAEAVFERMKRDIAPQDNGDIWHEGYGGSIFQIVSTQLVRARDRVDQLEWDTPLNRALAGLPARKNTTSKSNGGTR